MTILNFFKKNKTKEIDEAILTYEKSNKELKNFFDKFDNKVKNGEILELDEVREIMISEVKLTFNALKNTGIDIEKLLTFYSEKDNTNYIIEKSHRLPKYCTFDFSNSFLNNEHVKKEKFPTFEEEDIQIYGHELLKRKAYYQKALNNVVFTKQKIADFDSYEETNKPVILDFLNRTLALNEQAMRKEKLLFLKELINIKYEIEKSLNFFKLPTTMDMDTIKIFSYLRKLVDLEFLSSDKVFIRYTDEIPEILAPFASDLGFYNINDVKEEVKEEEVKKEHKEASL